MNSFLFPLFGKQLRAQLKDQKKQTTTLAWQLHAAQEQLAHVQDNLKNCVIFWQEIAQPEMETLKAHNADLEETTCEIVAFVQAAEEAKIRHRKMPAWSEYPALAALLASSNEAHC